MSIETLIEIVADELQALEQQQESDDPRGSDLEWYWGGKDALRKLKAKLQKHLEET
jgi:hypothetical protein